MQPKNATFNDRQATSAAAKQALLAKFKPKAAVQAEAPVDHVAERDAKIDAVRRLRQEEKEAKLRAREEAAAAAEQARLDAIAAAERAKIEAEHMSDAQKRAERKDRKKAIKEAAKAKKETRESYQPRAKGEERAHDPIAEHQAYIRSLERRRA